MEEMTSPQQRDLLLQFAGEEKRHAWIMQDLAEHVGRPGHNWTEFAEWRHGEDY